MTITSDLTKLETNRKSFIEYLNEKQSSLNFRDFYCQAIKGETTNCLTMPIGTAMLTPEFFVFLTDYQGRLDWTKVLGDIYGYTAAPYLTMAKWIENPLSLGLDLPKIFSDEPNFLEKALSSPNSFFIRNTEISQIYVDEEQPSSIFHIMDEQGEKFTFVLGTLVRPVQKRSIKDWAKLIGCAFLGFVSIEYEQYETDMDSAKAVFQIIKELTME